MISEFRRPMRRWSRRSTKTQRKGEEKDEVEGRRREDQRESDK